MRAFLLSGSAASVFVTLLPAPMAAMALTPVKEHSSPVHCNTTSNDSYSYASNYIMSPPPTAPAPVVSPPSPVVQPCETPPVPASLPPPPIPVSPVPQEKRMEYSAPPSVMNNRMSPSVAGLIAPQPENRERYAAEDVSGIMRVAETPVSTFFSRC